MNDFTMPAVLV